ncbi:MAG TPA: outer membrane protein assembly factor BamA [Candidatus Omnitrophota bacterium]|nr:outer membrane protein assembly factor BamA [Candidatus Omnitrophota bacterium]HRZ15741.1 outer membrane protein assembly factor BamA [Candidatus Omnitrophota bacterium]
MKKTALLFALFLCLINARCAWSQESSAANKTESKLVSTIEVRGNQSISTNTIVSKLRTQIGSPFHDTIISDDIKNLYKLGFFSDIKVDTAVQEDGVKVIITVIERPIIEKVTFSGNKQFTLKQLESIVKEVRKDKAEVLVEVPEDGAFASKEGQFLDQLNLDDDVRAITRAYERKGYNQIQVTHTSDVDLATNKARVVFKIIEGKKKRIKVIYVEGNNTFPDNRILKLIKTKKAWLFNPGILKDDVFSEDIDRIKSFYQREGFTDVTVDSEMKTDPRGRFWYISLKIQEGKRYYVGTLTVKGNVDVPEQLILSKVEQSLPDKIFSADRLDEDIMSIQSVYFDRGYIAARVDPATSLNPETGKVDIQLQVQENEIAYVNKINIRGNIKTKDLVIRREMRIKPGERFDGDKLRRSKERLQNLGYFEEVSYDTEDTGEPNKKDLIVDVKESKTGAFSFGGGYSSVDNLVGFLEVEQKNFDWKNWPYFTGAGQDLKARASFGSYSQGYELSFTEPWMFDYPVSFGFDLYKHSREREEDTGYGYDEDVTGGDLRLGKELSEYVRANLTYTYDTIKITNISTDATQDLKAEEGTNQVSSMEFGLSFDNRDNVFDPTRGDLLTGSMQVAGGPFGGDKEFWKFFGRESHYLKLFKRAVVEFKGRVGLADTYEDSERIPIYERFFAGGAYTVRGYRERKVGPVDSVSGDPLGGEALLVGNIEYLYPVVNFMKLALFYDVGNVWSRSSDLGSGGFKSSYGFGMRLKTPIGPVMLDYGIPLNKESGRDKKDSGRFHFSMSHGF